MKVYRVLISSVRLSLCKSSDKWFERFAAGKDRTRASPPLVGRSYPYTNIYPKTKNRAPNFKFRKNFIYRVRKLYATMK